MTPPLTTPAPHTPSRPTEVTGKNPPDSAPAFELKQDAAGQWMLHQEGTPPEAVHAVRSFPLSAPDEAIALVGSDGHERWHITHLNQLTPAQAQAVRAALVEREFFPKILRLRSVNTFATPSTWSVDTDRGPCELVLKGEEDIRRLKPRSRLLINSAHGVVFEIPDMGALDRLSRKWLERFL